MVTKVKPQADIVHSDGNDGRDSYDYIQYYCPKCHKMLCENDIACDTCGTFFDWSSKAHLRTVQIVVWE